MFVHLISSLWFICILPVSAEWYYAYLTISPHIEYMMLMYTSSAVITLFIVYLLFALVCWAVLILSFCNLKKSNKKSTYFPDHRLLSPFLSTNDSTLYTLAHPVDRPRLSCNRLLLLLLTYDKLSGSVIFHSSCICTFFVSIHLYIIIYRLPSIMILLFLHCLIDMICLLCLAAWGEPFRWVSSFICI